MATDNSQEIDLRAVLKRVISKKWRIIIVAAIAFAVSCIMIFPVPRYYTASVELAPELDLQTGWGGGIADIASSMGLNLNDGLTLDAISPELYPELLKSNNFVINLIDCKVKSSDGKINTTYYDYLAQYQKYSPWAKAIGAVASIFKSEESGGDGGKKSIDPFKLTKEEDDIFNVIKGSIRCSVDKKTDVITIVVEDQDPLIAATMSNAAMHQLQEFITRYRTSKARNDVDYYTKLTKEAKAQYEKARRLYGGYSDANMDVLLQSFKSRQEDLENNMQLKFNTYSGLNTQLEAAKAKLQERTPAFTVLKSASVPIRPAGPKRMMFVAGFTLMALFISVVYFSRDLIF